MKPKYKSIPLPVCHQDSPCTQTILHPTNALVGCTKRRIGLACEKVLQALLVCLMFGCGGILVWFVWEVIATKLGK